MYLNFGLVGMDESIEKKKLLALLNKALARDKDLAQTLRELYQLYCHGYTFLQDIALNYGLLCIVPPSPQYKVDYWEQLTPAEQKEILDSFYPKLELDLKAIITLIEQNTTTFYEKTN